MSGPAWLILPTFDEAENLEAIVRASLAVLARAAPAGHRILVVDDSSPDGTGDIADRLAAEIEAVEVLHRTTREGLGPAYLAGFAHALAGGAAYVLEMDSDFSHDPEDLARLLAAATDADLVLGSRYVPGGGVLDWGIIRRLVSRGGSWYAQRVLGLRIRPHRRLQVLSPRGARGDRPADDPLARLRLPGGAHAPRGASRLSHRRAADRLSGP